MSTVVADTKAEKVKPLSREEILEKEELLVKLANGDTSILPKLTSFIDRENKAKESRKQMLGETFASIFNLDISFKELMEATYNNEPLYQDTDVKHYAENRGWLKAGKGGASLAEKIARTRKPREGTLIFSIQPTGAVGAPTKIMKEDDFPILGIGSKMVWLFKEPGDMTKKLLSCAVPEAKDFLASEEGKQFTKKWADWISKEAPNYKPKAK